MSNLTINANSIYDRIIRIGRQTENLVSEITFNLSMWIEEYGLGECVLKVKRNGDGSAYPVPMTIVDGATTWTITDTDTARKGRGEIQLFYTVGEKVKTSPIFTTSCGESLVGGEVPEPYEEWLTELNRMTAEVEAAKTSADASAQTASTAAQTATEKASEAEQSATIASGFAVNASASATSASTSAQTATAKASEAAESAAQASADRAAVDVLTRVSSLDGTAFAGGMVIEAVGMPVYVSDVSAYSSYDIEESGWYVFARIQAPAGIKVTDETSVAGAAGAIVEAGNEHIDVAVRFDVAAMTSMVVVSWGTVSETFAFRATDLAVRNLDQRVTFYVYDADPFATWEYKRSEDAVFVGTKYYTEENGIYTQAAVKAHELIPAGKYYTHAYAATNDETFQSGITYYSLVSGAYEPAEVNVGDAIPASGYYVDQYTLSTDIHFSGTRYYEEHDGVYEQIAVKAGEPCSYYTKVVEYPLTSDTAFVGTEYWAPNDSDLGYTRAAVKAGEAVPEGEYFTHAYSKLTAAGKFAEGVRYYKLVGTEYELQNVTVGASYAKNVYYIDQWTPATGKFVGTAYWINEGGEWSQAAVIAGEAIPEDTYHLQVISWPQATGESFDTGEIYYTKSGTVYTEAVVVAGEKIPAILVHSNVIISGLVRNVTYRLNDLVDCPMEFILPEIDDETHGAWFEIRCRHAGAYSMTLTPPEGVKIATEHTQKETAGINMINLHYTVVDGVKIWRFMNTHSSIPA